MFQVRIHGRGGQGVVTAAEMLSIAAFEEGKHSQAVPSFGSERMGAPVVAYVRIDDEPIELREPVLELARLYGSGFRLRLPGAWLALMVVGGGALLGWLGSWMAVGRHLQRIQPK